MSVMVIFQPIKSFNNAIDAKLAKIMVEILRKWKYSLLEEKKKKKKLDQLEPRINKFQQISFPASVCYRAHRVCVGV